VKLEAEKLNSDRLYHNTVSEVERLSSKLKEATGKQTTALAAMVAASQAKTQLTGKPSRLFLHLHQPWRVA
jgi:hypothetical protein